MIPVLMSWSGGKDSCVALHELQRSGGYKVAALLTTVTRDYDRISMHGVRRELLQRQAQSKAPTASRPWPSAISISRTSAPIATG
jgi:diphthamide synthase (EF-2-diphthine--ammonia ligase)